MQVDITQFIDKSIINLKKKYMSERFNQQVPSGIENIQSNHRPTKEEYTKKYGEDYAVRVEEIARKLLISQDDVENFIFGDTNESNEVADHVIKNFNLPEKTGHVGEIGFADALIKAGVITTGDAQFLKE
jgi:hypothetical protein